MGGFDYNFNILSSIEAYDPVNDTWTSLAPMPAPLAYPGVAAVNGLVYVIGGLNFSQGRYWITGEVESYNPQTNTWTGQAPLPRPTQELMVATVGGLIYAFGGISEGRNENSSWVYNPQNETWKQRAAMPSSISSLVQIPTSVAAVGDKIYLFNQSPGCVCPLPINDPAPLYNDVYDVGTDTWSHWPALTAKGTRGNVISMSLDSMVAAGTKILVIGGNDMGIWCTGPCSLHPDPSPIIQYNFEYDTVAGNWTRRSDMPTGRAGLVTGYVNGMAYAIGGATKYSNPPLAAGYTASNEAYTPCAGICAPYQPSSPVSYLFWALVGGGALGIAIVVSLVLVSLRRRRARPPLRPLEPLHREAPHLERSER